MWCIYIQNIKIQNNVVQNKNTISGVYCSSRSFEYIFPAILKTVHSEKSKKKKTKPEIANHFNQPHQGNENRHDWQVPHNTPNNNYFNYIVCRYINS